MISCSHWGLYPHGAQAVPEGGCPAPAARAEIGEPFDQAEVIARYEEAQAAQSEMMRRHSLQHFQGVIQ